MASGVGHVSIHARRVTGDSAAERAQASASVSIHARRVTGDTYNAAQRFADRLFQFTPVV